MLTSPLWDSGGLDFSINTKLLLGSACLGSAGSSASQPEVKLKKKGGALLEKVKVKDDKHPGDESWVRSSKWYQRDEVLGIRSATMQDWG